MCVSVCVCVCACMCVSVRVCVLDNQPCYPALIELRRVYSQLEVHKHKKMVTNNPHLQKKRSSKRGLGRSLMRRITERPESVHIHRQASREGREGREGREEGDGDHGSNRSTLRRNVMDGAARCGSHLLNST